MSARSSSFRIPPLVFVGLAVLVVGLSWWGIATLSSAQTEGEQKGGGSGGPPPATVIMAPVESRISAQRQTIIGTLQARSRSEVAALEAGALLEISVEEGDAVKKGEVLGVLDGRRLKAQISEARAEVTVAEAFLHQKTSRVERSTIDLEMKEKLHADGAVSEAELLDARSANNVDRSVAEAAGDSLEAAKSRLELLTVRLTDLEIRAPFDGQTVKRHAELGEWVAAGSPVVTLVSSGEIEAWLKVPERFARSVRGSEIPVTIKATGETVTSTSLRIVPEAETATRTLEVIALLPNPDGTLLPGLSVTAKLPVMASEERLVVPVNAVVQGYSGPGIFVPLDQGGPLPVARRLPIEVIFQDNEFVYFKSEEVKVGDQVVVEGNERLFPFQPLMIATRENDNPQSPAP
jgi:RND family efflux transporter MFP subunit